MRKIVAFFCLMAFAGISEARVCFLPGVFNNDTTCLSDEEYAECRGFNRTTPCPNGQEQVSCNKNGRIYYRCYCRADMYNLTEHLEYNCKTGYTSECGCAAQNLECAPEYQYEGDGLGHCKDWVNTNGVDACILPNGKVFYKDCKCNDKYSFTCTETGLMKPGDQYACQEPSSSKFYLGCACASGWSANCNKNTDGCTRPMTSVYGKVVVPVGAGDYCFKCEEGVCPTSNEINMATYYCDFVTSVNFECEALGYIKAPTGVCPYETPDAGMIGVKCPFDRDYINCDTSRTCYLSKNACEDGNEGAVCDFNGTTKCYEVTSCNTQEGYINGVGPKRCVATSCRDGYQTGISSCVQEGYEVVYDTLTPKSGGLKCAKCTCNAGEACKYAYHQSTESSVIVAGSAVLSDKCCNGLYKNCDSLCNGRSLSSDPDPYAKQIETCSACGEDYYTILSCKHGYELLGGRCVAKACDSVSGYSSLIQDVKNCKDSVGRYEGAYGWKLLYQETSDIYQLREDLSCTKCVCDSEAVLTDCKWEEGKVGNSGLLRREDLCCNGKYKNCYTQNIPSEATTSACSDPQRNSVTTYSACDYPNYCVINSCKSGYKLKNNRCILAGKD